MESTFPFIFAAAVGFGHAFEADHLIAVSSLVTRRQRIIHAVKDGIYWGLGHTSTIFLIGVLIILFKAIFLTDYFIYFEIFVGIMLVLLGSFRLLQLMLGTKYADPPSDKSNHRLAYSVGLIHGLAGSGAMVLLVMTEVKGNVPSLIYLLIFGLGSIAGMLLMAGLFSLPFSRRITTNAYIKSGLSILSSILCLGYGFYIIMENLT